MIDALRARYPHLGLAVYAITPGGDVIVEAFTPDGSVISKQAPTERDALVMLFGPDAFEPETPEETPDADATNNDIFS